MRLARIIAALPRRAWAAIAVAGLLVYIAGLLLILTLPTIAVGITVTALGALAAAFGYPSWSTYRNMLRILDER